MEPVGLAVGLVGLFSVCMDAVQRIDSYRTADRDSRQLDAQLKAALHLLERWGDGVGISKGKLSYNHHPALDEPRTFSVVRDLLSSIADFTKTSNEPLSSHAFQKTPPFSLSGDPELKLSRWQKTTWALRGKLKQASNVQTLASLVSDLYSVASPDTASFEYPSRKQPGIGSVEAPYTAEIRELLHKVELELEAEKLRDLQFWIGGPPLNDLYNDSKDRRLEETCEWILHRDEFIRWKTPSSSSKLLWIKGPAGFGKTILCAKIVQELEETAQGPMVFFFLSSRFEGHDDPFSIIRSWLATLILRSPVARDIVVECRLAQNEQQATQAAILGAFHEVLMSIPDCVLVLDGLDECAGMATTDSKSVPHFLQELRKAVFNTTTKLLISSRGDPVIQQGLSIFFGYSEYTISPQDVGPDLMTYSLELVNAKLPNKDEPTRASIAQKLTSSCLGQFQWIKLQGGSLRKGRSRKQLERQILETPSVLDRLYDREWDKINSMVDSDKQRALSLLRWTAFALRPLTVYEITEAVLITENTDELPISEMPDSIDEDYVESMILDLCGSLIEVRHASTHNTSRFDQVSSNDSVGSQEVHLSHFSVREYLLLRTFPDTPHLQSNEKPRVANQNLHNLALAKSCVRYMSFPEVWNEWQTDDGKKVRSHFISYAASRFLLHHRSVQSYDLHLDNAINALFDERNENWESLTRFVDSETSTQSPLTIGGSTTPFMLAILFRLRSVAAYLIKEGNYDMNDHSFRNLLPLGLACAFHDTEIASLLLDNGADVDADIGRGTTSLIMAVAKGHSRMTELLLARGANASISSENGQTALLIASRKGDLKIVQLLLEKGADVSTAKNDGSTPLSAASVSGNLEIVKRLFERGADLNVGKTYGLNPLCNSIMHKHFEVAQFLLEHGADITIETKASRNALHVACKTGNLQIVNSMLGLLQKTRGVIDGPDHWGSTPLSFAARFGHVEVVRALLDTGVVDVNSSDCLGRTTVWWAKNQGHEQVVSLVTGTAWKQDPDAEDEKRLESLEEEEKKERKFLSYCDICMLGLSGEDYGHCDICDGGDFDICVECITLGGHCFDKSHDLE